MQAGARKCTIALGGIGGDAHSVGLTVLHHALSMSDYHVYYLSTQNELKDFFQIAPLANVVMISTLDGHGRYYLRVFPELIRKSNVDRPLWYLGGNLHLGDGLNCENGFLEMRFGSRLRCVANGTRAIRALAALRINKEVPHV